MIEPNYTSLKEYALPLLAHMACADRQLHYAEIDKIFDLMDAVASSPSVRQYVCRILQEEREEAEINYDILAVPESQREVTLGLLLAIACIDGACTNPELRFLDRVAELWEVSPESLKRLHELAEEEISPPIESVCEDDSDSEELSFTARAVRITKFLLGERGTALLEQILPSSVRTRVKEARCKLLLAGPDYDEAIERCARISREDFIAVDACIKRASNAIDCLRKSLDQITTSLSDAQSLSGTDEAIKNALKFLSEARDGLGSEAVSRLDSLNSGLEAKQRAVEAFTIAFLGKTKAGKSTLHAVVTGEGYDAIGKGRQRTTRYNRVYRWRSIRIIDTPGIGAPGGKSDEQIAESVVDEADVICYVMTNDSQQVKELSFMRMLRERAKPLIVLLNVKNDLTHPIRLKRFLEHPERLFALEGASGLQGHFDRIRRYVRECYDYDQIPIVPVMLFAALLSQQEDNPEHAKALRLASRIDKFLDALRISIIEHGPIRRSQNILACSADNIRRIVEWVESCQGRITGHTDLISAKKKESHNRINEASNDCLRELKARIRDSYLRLIESVPGFTELHWDKDQKSLDSAWKRHIKELEFQEEIETAVKGAQETLLIRVQEILTEIGREIELIESKMPYLGEPREQDRSSLARNLLKWGGGGTAAIGAIVVLFTPLGWILIGLGTVANIISNFFKSREAKRKKAVCKLTEMLTSEVQSAQQKSLSEEEKRFKQQTKKISGFTEEYFGTIVKGLESFNSALGRTKRKLIKDRIHLELAYARRVIAWVEKDLDQIRPKPDVLSVDRTPGSTMSILTNRAVKQRIDSSKAAEILQEEVVFRHGQK